MPVSCCFKNQNYKKLELKKCKKSQSSKKQHILSNFCIGFACIADGSCKTCFTWFNDRMTFQLKVHFLQFLPAPITPGWLVRVLAQCSAPPFAFISFWSSSTSYTQSQSPLVAETGTWIWTRSLSWSCPGMHAIRNQTKSVEKLFANLSKGQSDQWVGRNFPESGKRPFGNSRLETVQWDNWSAPSSMYLGLWRDEVLQWNASILLSIFLLNAWDSVQTLLPMLFSMGLASQDKIHQFVDIKNHLMSFAEKWSSFYAPFLVMRVVNGAFS